jgi:hypothetical protein
VRPGAGPRVVGGRRGRVRRGTGRVETCGRKARGSHQPATERVADAPAAGPRALRAPDGCRTSACDASGATRARGRRGISTTASDFGEPAQLGDSATQQPCTPAMDVGSAERVHCAPSGVALRLYKRQPPITSIHLSCQARLGRHRHDRPSVTSLRPTRAASWPRPGSADLTVPDGAGWTLGKRHTGGPTGSRDGHVGVRTSRSSIGYATVHGDDGRDSSGTAAESPAWRDAAVRWILVLLPRDRNG